MVGKLHSAVAVSLLLASLPPALAQLRVEDPPRVQPETPRTKEENDRLEAQKLYGVALLHEKSHRLIQAIKTYEQARKLDPQSSAILKALIPLYISVERTDDALEACQAALKLNPDDHEVLLTGGRLLNDLGRRKEALEMLGRAAKSPGLKDQPGERAQVLHEMGGVCEKAEDWAGAESACRSLAALLDNPKELLDTGDFTKEEVQKKAADTHERLGRLCLKQGKSEQAVADYKKALELDPARSNRLTLNLAQVCLARGQNDEALAQIAVYVQTKPDSREPYEVLATALRRLKRDRDIVTVLENLLKEDKDNVALKLVLGQECGRAAQAQKAEAIYTDLLQKTPTPEMYRGLFELYKGDPKAGEKVLHRLDKAIDAANPEEEGKDGDAEQAAHARAMLAALRDDGELVKALLSQAQARLTGGVKISHATRSSLAILAARTKQLDVAEQLYRNCLSGLRGRARQEQEHEVYGGLLDVLSRAHKHAEVIKVCQQGLEHAQNTSRVLFHVHMAEAYLAMDKSEEALKAIDTGVNEANDKSRLYLRRVRADMLTQAGKHDDAIAECQALLKEYNQDKDVRKVRLSLGHAYAAAKRYDEAEKQSRLLLELDPTDATAHNDLGYHLAERGKNLAEAEQLVRKAIDLDRKQRTAGTGLSLAADQDNAAYVDSLGWVLFKQGKFAEARKELEKAVALVDGEDPVLWDHLGDTYFRLGEKARAREAWKKSLALYDAGHRRKGDGRYKDIQDKLRLLEP